MQSAGRIQLLLLFFGTLYSSRSMQQPKTLVACTVSWLDDPLAAATVPTLDNFRNFLAWIKKNAIRTMPWIKSTEDP
jgi:hypothetical protein